VTYSIETIKSEIIRNREKVQKLYVDFTISFEPDEQLTKSQVLQQLGKSGYQKFAFDGVKRYNDSFRKFFSKNLADESLLMVYDGEKLFSRTQKRVSVSTKKSGSVDMCNYLNILLWPISTQDFDQLQHEAPEMVPFLPRMLDSKWTIDLDRMSIDQHECIRLVEEKGRRELFLSPKMNFAVVRYSLADEKTGRGFGKMICDFSSFQAYGDIFLPGQIVSEMEIFEGSTEKLAGMLRTRMEVRDLKINELVPTGLFEFSPTPGDMIIDYDTGEIQRFTEEGENNRLQLSLMEAKRVASQSERSDELFRQMWMWMLAAFCFGGACSFANRFLVCRRLAKVKDTLIVIFCICVVNSGSIVSCVAQESDHPENQMTAFEDIVRSSNRHFFDIDLDGTLVLLTTSYSTFETPSPLVELLLQDDVSKELELADFQINELRGIQQQLLDAQAYTVELISKNSILTEVEKSRCLEKLHPAINNGNKVVEKILLPFQKEEIAKILLIFQIRRIGLYSALTSNLLRGTIDCTPSQKAKMEVLLNQRNEELSKNLRELRTEAVAQILNLLDTKQRQAWEAKFGVFKQFDRGLHGVFIEQLGTRWIELAKKIKVDEDTEKYPQLAFLILNNNYIVGIDGFPKFDFVRPGLPPDPHVIDERLLRLFKHVKLRTLLDLNVEQDKGIEELDSLQIEYQKNRQKELNALVEKYGWDQKVLNEFRIARIEIRRKHSDQVLDRINNMLLPFQMNLLERLSAVHGFHRVGITYLLIHSDLRNELKITESQADAIQKKSEELFLKLRRESADLEQKINQELIAVLNNAQQATLKSITHDSIRMEAGQFDTQFLLRAIPAVAQEISEDQALILRFLRKEPSLPDQTD
jgi:hypothetical protein